MRHLRRFYPFSNIAGISTQKRLGLIFNGAAKLRRDQQTILLSKKAFGCPGRDAGPQPKASIQRVPSHLRAEHPRLPRTFSGDRARLLAPGKQQGTLFSTLPSRNLIRLREKHTYTRISFGTGHKRNFRSDTT